MSKKITLKTPAEIAMARVAGTLAAEVLAMIAPHVKPGVSTNELDRLCHDYIVNVQKAIPANVGYHGFPKTICASVNHVVCHGIPSDKPLEDGDIVNIDIAVIKDGWFGDTSRMYFVGKPRPEAERLVSTTYDAMYAGIRHPARGRAGRLQCRTRVLRARYRQGLSRRTSSAALRNSRPGVDAQAWHGVYHRADAQCW